MTDDPGVWALKTVLLCLVAVVLIVWGVVWFALRMIGRACRMPYRARRRRRATRAWVSTRVGPMRIGRGL